MENREIINFNSIEKDKNFWLMFLCFCFSNGIDEGTDMGNLVNKSYNFNGIDEGTDMGNLVNKSYNFDEEWFDEFTNSYEDVFDDNDGYVDNPKTLQLTLANKDILCIEFHPGDTIFFINDNEIGSTGPHYNVNKVTFDKFLEYSKNLSIGEKFLLIPITKITTQTAELKTIVEEFIAFSSINKISRIDIFTNIIINSCAK